VRRKQGSRGLIFVISGPSGSGKTTLRDKLLKDREIKKYGLAKSVSFTTRPKRSREFNGKEYFFITEDEFKQRIKAKKNLEWTKYSGYYYATPKDFLEQQVKQGKHIMLCLDLKGALSIKRLYPDNTVMIFIIPPSLEALRERIEKRCNRIKKEEVSQRLKIARRELLAYEKYDYCLVNKNLQQALKGLKDIVLKKITSSY
jgi:guanylate kinase